MVFEHGWPKLVTVSFDRLLPGDVYYGSLVAGEFKVRDLWLTGRVVRLAVMAPEGLSNHTVSFADGSHDLPWKSAVAIIQDKRKGDPGRRMSDSEYARTAKIFKETR